MGSLGLLAGVSVMDIIFLSAKRCFRNILKPQRIYCAESLFCLKPESTRNAGKPDLRWSESVEEGLKKMGVRNWGLN